MQKTQERDWLTVCEVPGYTGGFLSESSVRKMVLRNPKGEDATANRMPKIPFYRHGRVVRFLKADVDAWLESARVEASA